MLWAGPSQADNSGESRRYSNALRIWRQMPVAGQEHVHLASSSTASTVASATWTWTRPSSTAATAGGDDSRSFCAAARALVGQRGEGLVVNALEQAPQFSQKRVNLSHASMIRRLHHDVESGSGRAGRRGRGDGGTRGRGDAETRGRGDTGTRGSRVGRVVGSVERKHPPGKPVALGRNPTGLPGGSLGLLVRPTLRGSPDRGRKCFATVID